MTEAFLRVRVGSEDAHYGTIAAGAFVMQLFGDLATEITVRRDGDEGLLRAYESVEFLAPVRPGDRPLLDARGVVYEDNVYKHAAADRPLLKFVPTPGLQGELAQVGRAVHTSAPIRAVSMDGNRVALAIGGTSGCDGVWLWNIPWRSFEQVSQTTDLARITTLHPRTYNEARTIGEHFREGTPVIMNLTEMVDSDAKRVVDFAAGLIFGLRGSIERVTNKVFLLSPANVEVTAEDKARMAERGFFNQS